MGWVGVWGVWAGPGLVWMGCGVFAVGWRPTISLPCLMYVKDLQALPVMQIRIYPQYSRSGHVPQRFLVCLNVPFPSLCRPEYSSVEERGHREVSSVAPWAFWSLSIHAVSI